MFEGRAARSPVRWSRKRKAALVVFALIMIYLHSLYILGFYVTENEYWWPVWTGMTAGERLGSCALALFANLGLMVVPFVRAPGPSMRMILALSLSSGLLISVVWLVHDLSVMGFPEFGPLPKLSDGILGLLADIIILTALPVVWILYCVTIWMNAKFIAGVMRLPNLIRG